MHAVETSGYPLQGIITDKLKGGFGVTEEWGYIDRDTKEHRSLDIFAYKRLSTSGEVQLSVAMLIECKRSINPYVFFKNVIDRDIPRFPKIAGLTHSSAMLHEKGTNRCQETSADAILGLAELPFVRPGPPHCSAFAMALASGKKMSISGNDPYNSLILPLVKATDHAASLYRAGDRPQTLYPTLIIGISVLDAPMLLVDSPRQPSPILAPWVRVPRQEAHAEQRWPIHVYYVIDIVHADLFNNFLSDHLTPFLEELTSRVGAQCAALKKGGVVESLDSWKWNQIKPQA